MDKLSYALGASMGQTLLANGVKRIEFKDFLDGVKDIMVGREPKVSDTEGNELLNKYFTRIKKEKDEEEIRERAENKKLSDEFLKENINKQGVIKTKSGLQYRVITEGTGKKPTPHSYVKCHYTGTLCNGQKFDSSYDRGEPAIFSLEQVIPGWTEGLQLMSEGSKYEFAISPELGYGEVGFPGHIPGNSVLLFTVDLLEVDPEIH